MTTITYHDLASEYYMAYPLQGLLTEARAHGCRMRISKNPPPILNNIHLSKKDNERLFALGIFQVTAGASTRWFCIDAHDDSSLEGYFRPVLKAVDHYFKLNEDPTAFEKDRELGGLKHKVHPLGCTFAIRPAMSWRFLPRLRPCKHYGWNWFSIKRRLRALQRNPSMEWYRNLRSQPSDKDIFLVRRYYRDTDHAPSNQECLRIFESLNHIAGISRHIGFTGTASTMPDSFHKYVFGPERSLRDHLTHMARSRVGIFMPGTYNCLSFKFGQYLALGKPIVGMKLPFWPLTDMDPADKELLESQFCCIEPEEIPAKLIDLLRDRARMDFLKTQNIRIFERYFSPQAVAARILERVLPS